MSVLKVYADRMSQPSRAVILFCKLNGIEFEEVKVDLSKRQHFRSEFSAVNPLKKVPAIADGTFKLFESHAILIYLACTFPGVPDHWYPSDLSKRAKIHSILDWHHTNLRQGAAGFVLNSTLAPALGLPLNQAAAGRAEKALISSLRDLESVWLKGDSKFVNGGNHPSIADLSLVCELMQMEVVEEGEKERIMGPFVRVKEWMKNTRLATNPHFDEVHAVLHRAKENLREQRYLRSKM